MTIKNGPKNKSDVEITIYRKGKSKTIWKSQLAAESAKGWRTEDNKGAAAAAAK